MKLPSPGSRHQIGEGSGLYQVIILPKAYMGRLQTNYAIALKAPKKTLFSDNTKR